MPIDSSIYQALRPQESPSIMDAAGKAMTLNQLALQNQQLNRTALEQQAVRDAYARNLGPDGKLNQQGVLSDLGKVSPTAMMAQQEHFNKTGKDSAELDSTRADAAEKVLKLTGPALDRMKQMPEPLRAAEWDKEIQLLKAQGANVSAIEHPYNSIDFDRYYGNWQNNKEHLNNMLTQSSIAKNYSEAEKAKNEKTPTQSQFAAANYGTRAKQAEDVFGQLAANGYDATSTGNALSRGLPGIFEGFKGEDVKLQEQAERNFVNAIMRRESGAAISKDEFSSAEKQYFPRVGDTPNVLTQKEQNRKTVTAALQAEGGPANARMGEQMGGMKLGSSVPVKKSDRGGVIQSAQADGNAPPAPKPGPGSIINVQGARYTVGPDGESLVPVVEKRK